MTELKITRTDRGNIWQALTMFTKKSQCYYINKKLDGKKQLTPYNWQVVYNSLIELLDVTEYHYMHAKELNLNENACKNIICELTKLLDKINQYLFTLSSFTYEY